MKVFYKRTLYILFTMVLALGLATVFAFNAFAEDMEVTEKQTYEESLLPVTIVNGDYKLTINKTIFEVGEEIIVSASGPNSKDWVGLYQGSSDSSAYWNFVDDVGDGVKYNLIKNFPDGIAEGEYIIRLQANDSSHSSDTKAIVKIKVGNPKTGVKGDKTALSTDKSVYKVGEPVKVTATATTSNSWVGMYWFNHYAGSTYKWHWVDKPDVGGGEYSAPGSGIEYDVTRGEALLPGYYTINLFPDSATDWDAVVASTTFFVESSYAISYESIVGDNGEIVENDDNTGDSDGGDNEEDEPIIGGECVLTFTNGDYSLTINKTQFAVGESIYISAKGVKGNNDWVGIYSLDGNSPILKQVIDNVGHGVTYDLRKNYSELNIPSLKDLPEGEYIIRLQADDRSDIGGTKALVKIKIGNPQLVYGNSSLLSVEKHTYNQGEPIMVTPHMVEGYSDSWVGIYQFGNYFKNSSVVWEWVNTNGSGNAYDVTEGITLSPGAYLIMLFPYDTGDMTTCVAYTSVVVESEYTNAWDNVNDPVHNYYEYGTIYENGFENSGKHIYKCTGCYETKEETVPALFTCLGYSAPENGDGGIAMGFLVNEKAIVEYEKATGKTLKYGVFAVSQGKLGDNAIFGENGAANGVISVDVTTHGFDMFEIKIVGFTDEQKSMAFAMGAYVAATDKNGTEYSYMQDDSKGASNGKYYFASYNDIIKKPSTGEEVAQ